MTLTAERQDDGIVRIRVDQDDDWDIAAALEEHLAANERRFLLDLDGHAFLNSIKIAGIIQASKLVAKRGGTLVLANLCPQLQEIFGILKLERLFDLGLDDERARGVLLG